MPDDGRDGGPAFPLVIDRGNEDWKDGLSKRDYFAAHAMNTLLHVTSWEAQEQFELLAKTAYKVADAMLEARKP